MNQTEARQMAEEVSEHTGRPWVADTPGSRSGRTDDLGDPKTDWGVREYPIGKLWLYPQELRNHLGL